MSQHTRQDIIAATLTLAAKKPLNRISVREITTACGVTRNTFYYHFHDIYEVVTSFFEQEAEARFDDEAQPLESRLLNFIELCSGYKRVWLNLYRSIGYEQFSRYIVDHVHTFLLEAIGKEYDLASFPPEDLDLICSFYEEAICGALLRLLRSRKENSPEDLMQLLNRAKFLFNGQMEQALERSADGGAAPA